MFEVKVVENIETQISCSANFLFENRTVYEIMWKNIKQQGRPQLTKRRMLITCCIRKGKTHSPNR
jgi:hypothetical protein